MDNRTCESGPDKRVPPRYSPLYGLEDRVPPTGDPGSIQADGKVVKAKAFTEKRR